MDASHGIETVKYHLEPGYIFISTEPALITAVLGSCVAVCLHDRGQKIGGMNHFLYPAAGRRMRRTPQFGSVALPALIRLLLEQGSRLSDLEAQVFGGGRHFLNDPGEIGRKNVNVARKILKKYDIPLVSEDVGGVKGRRLAYHTGANEAMVMKTHKIRRGDFFPYRNRIAY